MCPKEELDKALIIFGINFKGCHGPLGFCNPARIHKMKINDMI
jgi:hypothetical protein